MKLNQKKQEKVYTLELAGLIVTGLGMMLLIIISSWMIATAIINGRQTVDEIFGTIPNLSIQEETIAAIGVLTDSGGQVAGVVDDASIDEADFRNELSAWLSNVRGVQGLEAVYRDRVLDRQAQNHARRMADACDSTLYNAWEEQLYKEIDEGVITTYSEAAFFVNGTGFARELPIKEVDYSRLFGAIQAYGVGVAATPQQCGNEYIAVFHLAGIERLR